MKCVNCRNSSWKRIISTSREYDKQNYYSFYKCLHCGLIQINPFPKKHVEKNLYSFKDSDLHNQKISLLMRFLYVLPFGPRLLNLYVHLIHRNRQKIVESFLKRGRLLDAGCGTGEFLTLFDTKNWSLTGIEVNPHMTKIIKASHPDIHMFSAPLEKFNKSIKFEVITLWHVLEHLQNPDAIVKKMRHLLSPEGLLFIEIPQGNSLGRKLFGKHWNLLLTPEHIYFWTASSLAEFLKRTGFEIQKMQYRGHISSLPGSIGNWLRNIGMPNIGGTLVGLSLLPVAIFIHELFPTTRDNLLIVARKSTTKVMN